MYFKHFFEKGLAQNSFMIGCQATGEAIVIDPRRDISPYLKTAEENDLRITKVTETHIHADFLSGSRELAAATEAELYLSDEGGPDWLYHFDHHGLKEGDSITVGNLRLDVMHTPGHTPEHISFVLFDLPSGQEPMMVFTGDYVFVGDVGRPDLLEEAAGIKDTKVTGAKQLFASLRKFRELPGYVQVWPAHGAGSACGKALGAVPASTVGYELATNWAFQIDDEEEFVRELLDGQPEPPYYFAEMKTRNRAGAAVLGSLPQPERLDAAEVERLQQEGAQVVDARSRYAYAGGHIPESQSLPFAPDFSNWAGWTLAYDTPIILVASEDHVPELVKMLVRIGLDEVVGYLPSVDPWADAGKRLLRTDQITSEELAASLDEFTVLDVRSQSEFEESHIPGAVNIHAGRLHRKRDEIPRNGALVVHCQSGYRSIIACGQLERIGITNVHNLVGGYDAWEEFKES
jgi:hydroxyacylglutathione hydrolase